MFSYEKLSTKEHLIKINEDEAVYMVGPERYAQQIVTALNAWQEIQQEYQRLRGFPRLPEDVLEDLTEVIERHVKD